MALLFLSPGYTTQASSSNQALLGGLKPVVFIGRLLCTLSRDDVLKRHEESYRKSALFGSICGALSCFFLVNAILLTRANLYLFQIDKSGSEKLGELSTPMYAFTMCFVYFYQIFGTKRFRQIIQNFVEASRRTHLTTPFPASYTRFCWVGLVFYMACGITENAMFDVQSLRKAAKSDSNTTLELYYTANFYHWSEIIPYYPITTLIYVIIIKIGTWGWVYMDIIVIVLCRAITEKFRVMNQEVSLLVNHQHQKPTPHPSHPSVHLISNPTQHLTIHGHPGNHSLVGASTTTKSNIGEGSVVGGGGGSSKIFNTTLTWDSIRDEFVMLTELVAQIEKFVAPLILACYGANMYIIVIMLLNWIAPYSKFSPEQSSYVYFAFVQFMFRVSAVTYFAAEVHHVSLGITGILQKCPNSMYSLSLERLERTFICTPTGISLFGSFMITRRFFISIISFIFTTEIVLLQTANAPRPAK